MDKILLHGSVHNLLNGCFFKPQKELPLMNTIELTKDLDELLSTASTDEFRSMACEAAGFLYETQVEEFSIRLQNVISDVSDQDNAEIVANVAVVLRECLDDYLLDHRIVVSEDAHIRMVVKVAKAVLELPFWQETDTVVDLCMQDSPAKDRFADLVKLVCGGETQTIAAALDRVDDTFLSRLIRLVQGSVEDLQETVLPEDQIKMLKNFKGLYPKTFALQMVELGWRIGSPLSTYLSRAQTRLVQLNNQDLAKEVVAFILMGQDSWFDGLAAWNATSGQMQLELNVQAEVTVEIRKILQTLAKFEPVKAV